TLVRAGVRQLGLGDDRVVAEVGLDRGPPTPLALREEHRDGDSGQDPDDDDDDEQLDQGEPLLAPASSVKDLQHSASHTRLSAYRPSQTGLGAGSTTAVDIA